MPAKTSPIPPPSTQHPPVGTLIDDGNLELVDVLGVGGYGVVYRAIDTRSRRPQSYAVKCLMHSQQANACRQRQVHIREIALHQIASAHPNVITLHRIIEDDKFTYIIMDFASDGDLFSQILHSCRYLGDDYLIKHVFLQILDAVEYCHSLGIYHRDLKPENILCYDDGLRVAITDFGLATTDKFSTEFRTGSVYHMSPECQGGTFAYTGGYSPMFNDIWSLAIILLNLTTGRNPWKSASLSDPTFQAYVRDPDEFLPQVLPISPELNEVLKRMLELDWKNRMTIPELRQAIEGVDTFYSDGVIFEGSMARCPWEASIDIDCDSSMKEEECEESMASRSDVYPAKSHWSKESASDIVFANRSSADGTAYNTDWRDNPSSCCATWAYDFSSSDSGNTTDYEASDHRHTRTPTTPSALSPAFSRQSSPSLPPTPGALNSKFQTKSVISRKKKGLTALTVNTDIAQPRYFNSSMGTFSTSTSAMQTAIDEYGSSFFLASPASRSLALQSVDDFTTNAATEDKEMESPSIWEFRTDESLPSVYSTTRGSFDQSSMACDERPPSSSPETVLWPTFGSQPIAISSSRYSQCQPSAPIFPSMTDYPCSSRQPSPIPQEVRPKKTSFFSSVRFFPRSNSPPPAYPQPAFPNQRRHTSDPLSSFPTHEASDPSTLETWSVLPSSRPKTAIPLPTQDRDCRREAWLRSPRRWFFSGRLFTTTGTS